MKTSEALFKQYGKKFIPAEMIIPYGIGKLLEFAGKNIRSPIKSERAPPYLRLSRRDCIEVGNYLKELGL
jgi:hypothetical protein